MNLPPKHRYYLGSLKRAITAPFHEQILEPSNIATIFGCRYGQDGWHPLVETLKQFDAEPNMVIEKTSLWLFHQRFRPTTSLDFLIGSNVSPLPVFMYPWGNFNTGDLHTDKNQYHSRFCGPSPEGLVTEEFRQLIELYQNIKTTGFTPSRYPHYPMAGTLLKRNNGEKLLVILQGNHRIAVLAHMGFRSIKIRTDRNAIRVVDECNIDQWPMVKAGLIDKENARQYLNFFFEATGKHIKKRYFEPPRSSPNSW